MTVVSRAVQLGGFLFAVFLIQVTSGYRHIDDKLNILRSSSDESTAMRFFFNPGEYYHSPLIFRVVAPNDSRLNTGPMYLGYGTVYISATEMDHLKRDLTKLGLSWQESKTVEDFDQNPHPTPLYAMVITVVSSKGTAIAGFDPAQICRTLAPLDSTLKTTRALWEFQVFRTGYGCRVPGLDIDAYPDVIR
jgi:hypothetical protein